MVGQIFAQTSLNGKVTDAETGEALPFANVVLYKDSNLVTGAQTDFDGFYNLASLDPGTYNVEATYSGYGKTRFIKVIVFGGQANNLDFELGSEPQILEYVPPKFTNQDPYHLTYEQLKKLPIRNLAGLTSSSTKCRISCRYPKMRPNLTQKLPSRTINLTVQNMLDLGVKSIWFETN